MSAPPPPCRVVPCVECAPEKWDDLASRAHPKRRFWLQLGQLCCRPRPSAADTPRCCSLMCTHLICTGGWKRGMNGAGRRRRHPLLFPSSPNKQAPPRRTTFHHKNVMYLVCGWLGAEKDVRPGRCAALCGTDVLVCSQRAMHTPPMHQPRTRLPLQIRFPLEPYAGCGNNTTNSSPANPLLRFALHTPPPPVGNGRVADIACRRRRRRTSSFR